MTTNEHFRISSYLKDIIGRDLVTNEFVAVFELVKNAFDAQASRVDIAFDVDNGELWIVDDGKGMDADAIRDRWLFVAYSAKADGTEDTQQAEDYRDRIRPHGQYAGSKGIGRFSCDTLGGFLKMYSRPFADVPTEVLSIKWQDFEADSRELFQQIDVEMEQAAGFPEETPVSMPSGSGTVLKISGLRNSWSPDEIRRLRRYLEKLIDPFGTTQDTPVHIAVVNSELDEKILSELTGPVGNDIQELLSEKTTRIVVSISGERIATELIDRGRTIYRISEDSPYLGLKDAVVDAEIYYLNRSAKTTFTKRMGVRPVEFGSIFLFVNGFRIFPIGEENDDTFGLNRRKQQGSSRYIGTRDIMGRVDVTAPPRMFREASSRDAGLIEDARVRDLFDAIKKHAIFRLERYVVGVTWADKADANREDASGLAEGVMKQRVVALIGHLATNSDLQLEYYDPEIVEMFDDGAQSLKAAMKSLTQIAEREGDRRLMERLRQAQARQVELEESEREATEAAQRAMAETARADERIARLERQATYLAATQDMTAEQMTLLLHQVLIYAGHIGSAVDRALGQAKEITMAATDIEAGGEDEDLTDAAASIRVTNKNVIDDLEYMHLENDRLMAVARFASNARFDLETDRLNGDVIEFLEEYVNKVRASRDGAGSIVFQSNDLSFKSDFRPVDLVVVVDNLMDNARKHGATSMQMSAVRSDRKGGVEVLVQDDGRGLEEGRIDPERIFDKGYSSSPNGTGLGLYHVSRVLEDMGGSIRLDPNRESGRASFIISLPKD